MKNQKSIDQESLELYSKEYFIVISENGFIHIGRPKPINCPIMGDIIRVFDCYTIKEKNVKFLKEYLTNEPKWDFINN